MRSILLWLPIVLSSVMPTPLWAQQSVRLCQRFSHGDFGQRVNECIASLPAKGGIADATGFGSADIRQNNTIAITKDNVQLRLPPARIIHSGVAIAINANHVDIGGAAKATVLKMAGGQAANCNAHLDDYSVCSITVATTRAVDNLKIHDLEIDGNAAEQGAVNGFAIQSNTRDFPLSTFEFYNLYLHDHKRGGASAGGNEIQTGVSGTGKGNIHHVTCRNHSCAIVFGDDIRITDNQAFNSDDDAFGAVGGPGWTVNHITIANNQVEGTTAASCYRLVNGRNSTITGNRCKNPNFDGITVDDNGTGSGNYTTDTTIAGNNIVAPRRNGITILGQHITVIGNTVTNCGIEGIAVNNNSANVLVASNTVNACNGPGGPGGDNSRPDRGEPMVELRHHQRLIWEGWFPEQRMDETADQVLGRRGVVGGRLPSPRKATKQTPAEVVLRLAVLNCGKDGRMSCASSFTRIGAEKVPDAKTWEIARTSRSKGAQVQKKLKQGYNVWLGSDSRQF